MLFNGRLYAAAENRRQCETPRPIGCAAAAATAQRKGFPRRPLSFSIRSREAACCPSRRPTFTRGSMVIVAAGFRAGIYCSGQRFAGRAKRGHGRRHSPERRLARNYYWARTTRVLRRPAARFRPSAHRILAERRRLRRKSGSSRNLPIARTSPRTAPTTTRRKLLSARNQRRAGASHRREYRHLADPSQGRAH